ncbi:DUF2156 domain-containing protein [Lactococcus hircilactis]|uniref:DUF2156 domain-containing protein n=1 Tax=Lactococcus hircilactis TaxID=1494462 RepID=A0A7X1Z6F7_9LACT|nr:phosphatidylglycerol lysyltransferase domain-containing protein [Lactococcus hircilactis]MQW38458.1 DUF2156 domain-containing protein [Lactococcus hircilactis]
MKNEKTKKIKSKKTKPINAWQETAAKFLGWLVQFASIYALIVGIMGWLMPPVQKLISGFLYLFALPTDFSIFNAIVLFILASSIRHRRRLALWIEVIYFQLAFVLFGLIFLLSYWTGYVTKESLELSQFSILSLLFVILGVLVSLGTAFIMILSRHAFPTKIINGTWGKAIIVAIGGFVFSNFFGLIVSYLSFHGSVSLGQRMLYVFRESVSDFRYLLPFGQNLFTYSSGNNIWVSTTISVIMLFGFITAFLMFTRSNQRELSSNAKQELAIRQLILDYGTQDSLAYFATRRDKKAIFSKNGKAAITYHLFGDVLLASGDPIGEEKSWKSAIEAFLKLARAQGWTPAVVGSSEVATKLYTQLGLNATVFGDEAVVLVHDFSTENPGMHDVAQVMRRAERENYQIQIRRQADLSTEELNELTQLTEKWRNGDERGYSMTSSRFGDPTDQQVMIVTATNAVGNYQGILSFVPVGTDKLSLDSMRRAPDAMNGVVTFMITSLIEAGKEKGLSEISLNFAAARQFFINGETLQANPLDKAARTVMKFFSRWYQLESLYRSNDIYLPEWRTRYICYDNGGSLTSVLLAIGQAEGFVPTNIASKIKHFFVRNYDQRIENVWWKKSDFIKKVHQIEEKKRLELMKENTLDDSALQKLNDLKQIGIPAFSLLDTECEAIEILRLKYENTIDFDENEHSIQGKIISLRGRGAMFFADLSDHQSKIQLVLKRDLINDYSEAENRLESFAVWKKDVTVGDRVRVTGVLMRTQTGELSLRVHSWKMLTKTLVELTDDKKDLQATLIKVTAQLSNLRKSLILHDFVEVEPLDFLALSLGFDQVFFVQELKVTVLLAYQSKEKTRQLLNDFVDDEMIIDISDVFPDPALNDTASSALKSALTYGLPAFTMTEITLSQNSSDEGASLNHEKK